MYNKTELAGCDGPINRHTHTHTINVSTEHLKRRLMLWQLRVSMLSQTLHVAIYIQKIQSSDWTKSRCALWHSQFPAFCHTKHHFRWSDKQVVIMSIFYTRTQIQSPTHIHTHAHMSSVPQQRCRRAVATSIHSVVMLNARSPVLPDEPWNNSCSLTYDSEPVTQGENIGYITII